jgi:hypothetical protein
MGEFDGIWRSANDVDAATIGSLPGSTELVLLTTGRFRVGGRLEINIFVGMTVDETGTVSLNLAMWVQGFLRNRNMMKRSIGTAKKVP